MTRLRGPYAGPAGRTDRLVDPPDVRHEERAGALVADTPRCRLTQWGHRVAFAEPPWEGRDGLVRCFARWLAEHGGQGIGTAYVTWEATPADPDAAPPPPSGARLDRFAMRVLEGEAPSAEVPAGVTLRPLRGDADWEALFALECALGWGEGDEEKAYLRWSRGARRAWCEAGAAVQLGAFAGEQLVGCAAVVEGRHEGRYQAVAVHEEHRGRGIAGGMVASLARWWRHHRGEAPLWIGSEVGSGAERVYARLGFAVRSTLFTWAMDDLLDEATMRARFAALRAGTLPTAQWRHADHLWGAVCVLREHDGDVEAALDDFRAVLRHFLASHGIETKGDVGYHETVTRAWLTLIGAQGAAHPDDSLEEAVIRARLAFSDKRHLLRYWSREALSSPEARAGWVPPDRAPLAGTGRAPAT